MNNSEHLSKSKLSNEYLASIVENSDDAIITKSLEGIITSWNPAAEKILGYTAEEVIGQPISLIVPAERGSEEPEILAKLRRGEKVDHFETVRVRKDGTRIEVSVTISPVRDDSGHVIGASKILRDITAQKLAQEEITAERERLRVTLDSIGDAVIVTDTRGSVDYMNPVAEGLTGWTRKDAAGKPLEAVFDIINEGTRVRVGSPVLKALAEGLTVGFANHTILISKNGSEVAIDDSAAPIRDKAGKVSGVILVFRDVSSRRAIEDFREKLAAIVESSDDAIIGKTLDGRITSWNKAAERIFGYSSEEALGRPITMLIPPDRLGEETTIIERLRRGERIEHFETVRLTKGRKKVDVSLTISPIRDPEGTVIGASKIARDISDQKRAARALQRHAEQLEALVAERTAALAENLNELRTFSSGLSHDIRAPLRAITGFTQTLLQENANTLTPDAIGLVNRILESCARLSKLVEDVVSYSRVRGSDVPLQHVNLDALVPQVLQDHTHAKETNADIQIERPLPPVHGNESLLTQCISNLVSNAVKFVRPGTTPKVNVRADRKNGRVRLWFEDNGIGIPKNEQDKVFELFTRLHGAQHYYGSGIGLAVVKLAARLMGGSVGLESEPGKGSRFWIDLKGANGDEGLTRR